jgi:DeoR family transcriptional regulator, fructose operon transcriptional repressor
VVGVARQRVEVRDASRRTAGVGLRSYLQRAEFASLDELARIWSMPRPPRSDATCRRWRSAGSVRRTHGGARLVNPKSDEFAFASRDTHELDEKEAIGRLCAGLIRPNQSLILDAGTTVFHAARHLEPKSPQVITNSLPVANLFGSNPRMEVLVSGGVIYPRLGVLVGPMAVEAFSRMHADVAIMSSGRVGITVAKGLSPTPMGS